MLIQKNKTSSYFLIAGGISIRHKAVLATFINDNSSHFLQRTFKSLCYIGTEISTNVVARVTWRLPSQPI